MRKLTVFLLTLLFGLCSFSQSDLVGDFKLDFAIPDNPAFKLLGKDPSNLMRPSNLEELTTGLSDLKSGSGFLLPESFALEIAPDLMINRNTTLQEYSNAGNRFLRSIRISLGTSRVSENDLETDLAAGLRFSIINDGEYKTSAAYRAEIAQLLSTTVNRRQLLAQKFREKYNVTPAQIAASPALQEKEAAYIDDLDESPDEILEEINKRFEENNWNARKFDVAIALRGVSPNDLSEQVKLKAFGFWSTYANGIGSWGQYLIGFNYKWDELTPETNNLISLNSRLYAGKNKIKGFLEAQYEMQDLMDQNSFLVNSGFEVNITGSLWADISFGIESIDAENQMDGSAFRSDFDINYRF